MHSKGTENLLNKHEGGEKPILRSKQLFSDASQTSDVDTLEMAVSKAGFEAIINLSLRHTEYKDVAAAALAISKALSEGSDEQIRMFMQRGCVGKLCESLKSPDPKIVVCCLEGLRNILKVGRADKRAGKNSRGKSIYAEMIDDCGGFDLMEDLLIHSNPKVTDWFEAFKKAVVILLVYSCSDVPDSVEESDEFVVINLPPEFESDPFGINLHLNESSRPEVVSFTIA